MAQFETMPFDPGLAHRIEEMLETRSDIVAKKMFGGLAFLVNGNMACGIVGDELMVRVGPDDYEDALRHPAVREMDFTGRALKGFVYVGAPGIAEDDDLHHWVGLGIEFASGLPSK